MRGKDKGKRPEAPQKKTEPKKESEAPGGSGKHPEQKEAEQEEEQTLEERESEEPETPESSLTAQPSTEPEDQKESEEAPSLRDIMQGGQIPIVGIGASAGGLQALEAFFDAVPSDSGLSFVVITHTDPEQETLLPDLIRRKSKIPVKLIREEIAAKPNTIYLPPSNRDLVLEQGKLHLTNRPVKSEMHMPVDLFLKHLAEEMGEFAACVILSGTGTDGTQGLRLIKEKAGLAVAQDPQSALHAGMPKSAIDTGLVDYVLPPAEMPERLAEYFQHPAAIENKAKRKKKTPDPLRQILSSLDHPHPSRFLPLQGKHLGSPHRTAHGGHPQ
jgi:two-component system CheB/CheR fusion protein